MINKKVKKIIATMILIIMFFPYISCFALTQQQAGEVIAKYAYNFCMQYGYNSPNNQNVYDWNDNRFLGYKLEKSSGTSCKGELYENKLAMDCCGFVNMVLHQSLGLGNESYTYFFAPDGIDCGGEGVLEYVTDGSLQLGDLLTGTNHVYIYIGELGTKNGFGDIAESGCFVSNPSPSNPSHGASMHDYRNNGGGSTVEGFKTARIKSDVAAGITSYSESPTGVDVSGGTTNIFANGEESEFYYNGIPDGKYSIAGNFWEWIVDSLLAVFEFLVNLCGYVVRMVFVGWTFIVEEFVTNTINSITNTDTVLDIDSTTIEGSGFNFETDDNITIEKIIFDQVKVFDVNFFNIESDEEVTAEE